MAFSVAHAFFALQLFLVALLFTSPVTSSALLVPRAITPPPATGTIIPPSSLPNCKYGSCTKKCWDQAVVEANCVDSYDAWVESACMCNENGAAGQKTFHACLNICIELDDFNGCIWSYQECPGFSPKAKRETIGEPAAAAAELIKPVTRSESCTDTCWNDVAQESNCTNADKTCESECMCDNGAGKGYQSFHECLDICIGLDSFTGLQPHQKCVGYTPKVKRVAVAESTSVVEPASANVEPMEHADTNPTSCTSACWLEAASQSGCINGDTDAETACICNSLTNYEYFYDCNLVCIYTGQWAGLNSVMECQGYHHRVIRAAEPRIPEGISLTDSINYPAPSYTATIASVRAARAAEPRIPDGILTSYALSDTVPAPTFASVAATPVPVSVSGSIWSGILPPKPTIMLTSTRSLTYGIWGHLPEPITKRQIAALVPWRTDHSTKPTYAPKPYTHGPISSGYVGFCGVPGENCNWVSKTTTETASLTANSTSEASATVVQITATITASSANANKVRDISTFIPSLVRMCKHPDLVDCYIPLAPDVANQAKDTTITPTTAQPMRSQRVIARQDTTSAPTLLVGTLSVYGTWTTLPDGEPLPTVVTEAPCLASGNCQPPAAKRTESVSPSGDCEIPGVACGEAARVVAV